MSRTMKLGPFAAVVAAALLIPHGGAAQVMRARSGPQPSPALELETKAQAWLNVPSQWSRMARLLEQAAQIRAADDPRAVDDLVLAAAAHWWTGNGRDALGTYVAAGERALSLGDVVGAAHAFLAGAVIANEQKQGTTALDLKARAERLAHSPLLSLAERQNILGQFAATTRLAGRQYTTLPLQFPQRTTNERSLLARPVDVLVSEMVSR